MILGNASNGRSDPIPVEPIGRRCHAQFGGIRRPAGQPAVPSVRRQDQRLTMMNRGKIAIRGTCHHHKPVFITTPQQQSTKCHHSAIGKLHMPWPFGRRPFVPAAGDDQTAPVHEGIAEGRLFGHRFHPRIDQKAAPLAAWWQPPCRKDRLRLKSGLRDDKRGLRRGHIPSRLQVIHYRHAKEAHQFLRRRGACETATHGQDPSSGIETKTRRKTSV